MYTHTLIIKLVTHNPVVADRFADQVQKMIGLWCDEVKIQEVNKETESCPAQNL